MKMKLRKITFILVTTIILMIILCGKVGIWANEKTLQGERIYQIMTDRFYDGDITNNATGEAQRYQEITAEDMRYLKGGDWQGIIDKLPYIKGMGYSAIWISPVMDPQLWSVPDAQGVQGPTAYHGYHIYDSYRASRYFGAEDPELSKIKLKELVDACHNLGIKVIFDIVPNHIGDYLKGVGQNARYSNATEYKPGTQLQPTAPFNNVNWYHNLGPIDWTQEHPHNEWSTQMLETHDLGELDDIDFDVPEAKQAILNANKYWFEYTGADAARVDAAKCMKPSDIHDLQEYLGVPSFGENFDMHVDFVSNWVGENGETGMLDFPLFQAIVDSFGHGQSFSDTIKSVLDKDYLYGNNANEMVVFLDNHDRNRFLTEASGSIPKLQNALTFLFTVRGVPVVFQGTEQNRGNMYDDLMYGLADTWNRWSMVTRDENGNVITDYFDNTTDTYRLISKLNNLKETYEALRYGTQREMWSSSDVYVFSRRIDSGVNTGAEMICAFNNSNEKRNVFVPIRSESSIQSGTVLENVLDSTDRITVSNNKKICIELKSNSNKIYKVSENQTKTTVPVTFYIKNAITSLGQNIYISGSSSALGNWNVNQAAGPGYCPTYPMWSVTVNHPVNSTIEFKAIKINGGSVEWEGVGNRSYFVAEESAALSFEWSREGEKRLIPVKFIVNNAQTTWGENIYISGNIDELGVWNIERAVGPALCPGYPTWELFIDVPRGEMIEWKAVKKGTNSIWQSGANNNYTVPNEGEGNTNTNWE
ncbi:glycosidase [Clostridiales bacterium COT073_COT-073]|nr:glycosidase [Clostridiales bacterium COT073_COT-073]